jgi:geranylgeranyl reductase family protein
VQTHDVIVVGGGPAGLFAARRLARAGRDVLLFEEHPHSGLPVHCTGVLAADAFHEFSLPPDAILNPLRRVRFHSPCGNTIAHETVHVEAVVIDRRLFDQQLHGDAIASGVRILTNHRVTAVDATGSGVVVQLREGRLARARVVIMACGASYGLARRLGFGIPSHWLQSAQLELPARESGEVEVYFGSNLAPRGFAWAVPVQRADGRFVRIGLMCNRDAAQHFRRFIARIGPRWGVDQAACEGAVRPRVKMLPLAPIGQTYGTRVLAIGDAAGLVKATTGGGIYYSLVSAAIASDVLDAALTRDRCAAGDLAVYERHWRRRLGTELDAQLSLRQLANHLDDGGIDGLFELARTDGILPLVRRTARFNEHRHLIAALFRHQPARDILFRRLASPWAAPLPSAVAASAASGSRRS